MRVDTVPGYPPRSTVNSAAHRLRATAKGVPLAVRWTLMLFVLSLPYEYADLGFLIGTSAAKYPGVLFFGSYFLFYAVVPHRTFARPQRAALLFLLYMVIFGVSAVLDPASGGIVDSGIISLVQLFILLWILADLLKDPMMAKRVLLTYAIATCFLSMAMLIGIPGFTNDIGEGRVEAMGDNANSQGQHMTLSCLILIGFALNGSLKRLSSKILVLPAAAVLLAGIMISGSRSGVLAFIVGCLIFVAPHCHNKRILASLILVLMGIGGTVVMIANNPELLQRFKVAYYEGDTAGRDEIYAGAIQMISEKPLTGWHPRTAFNELGRRVGYPHGGRDTHNLFLDLFLGIGLLGAIPFIWALVMCFHSAWRGRVGALGMLPLALITANIVASLGHTNLTWKAQWLVFAVALAAPYCGVRTHPQLNPLKATGLKRPIRAVPHYS